MSDETPTPLTVEEITRQQVSDTLIGADRTVYRRAGELWRGPSGRLLNAPTMEAIGVYYPDDFGPAAEVDVDADDDDDCPHCGGYLNDAQECQTCGWHPGARTNFGSPA